MDAAQNDMFNELCCGGGGGGGELDCTPVSFAFPGATSFNLNNPGPYFINVPLMGTAPFTLTSFVTNAPAGVLFANVTGNVLKIGMIPGNTILGNYNVSVRVTNCAGDFQDGAGTMAIIKPCVPVSFVAPPIINISISAGLTVLNIPLSGTPPFTKDAQVGIYPSGFICQIIGSMLAIGVQPFNNVLGDIAVNVTVGNCAGAQQQYIGILRITA